MDRVQVYMESFLFLRVCVYMCVERMHIVKINLLSTSVAVVLVTIQCHRRN